MPLTDSLDAAAAEWADTPDFHQRLADAFAAAVAADPALAAHRRYVEENGYGFGEVAFHWVWYLLARELPDGFRFLEIGVHRGQSLSAVDLAAALCGKTATVVGLGPLNGVGGYYEERDYEPDVRALFRRFNGDRQPTLIRGMSDDVHAVAAAHELAPYDAVYLDGDHGLEAVRHDFAVYGSLVRRGGYLLADDSGNGLRLPPHFFPGFPSSSAVLDARLPPKTANSDWRHVTNVTHLRIWKRL